MAHAIGLPDKQLAELYYQRASAWQENERGVAAFKDWLHATQV